MGVVTAPFSFARRELSLFLAFTWRDWSVTLIPAAIIGLGAVKRADLPIYAALRFLPWVTGYIYFFDLSNQITGVEEDRINKPDRPIPAGKVTLEGAKFRWMLALSYFLAVAIWNGTQVPETLTWIGTTAALSLTPVGGHWFTRNTICMSLGIWAQVSGNYKSVALPGEKEARFLAVVATWLGVAIQIQDLRDVVGDAATGRKTLPIVMGDKWCRLAIAFFFLPMSCVILWAGNVFNQAPIPLTIAHLILAYRVLRAPEGDARYDHKTYMLFTYLFCALLSFPIWFEL